MPQLAYKPTFPQVAARLESVYARRAMDQVFAAFTIPSPALADFAREYGDGFCDYPEPERRTQFWDRWFAERATLEDDSVPAAYLSEMDQGLYGGLFGGNVQFMTHPENGWISSMVAPLLGDWSELDRLRFDGEHPWFARYRRQLAAFVAAAAGKFAVSHFILINGLNFAFELVGATETYLALMERPETVRRAIELAFEVNLAVQEAFFAGAPLLAGGTASNMVQWIPGRVISESVDPFHMTSVDYFETWGRGVVERIFARFDGGVLHIHGNGRHLLPAVATVRGLKAIYLGDDHGFPSAFEVLPELRQKAGDVPLVLAVDCDRFVDRLRRRELPGGVLYKVGGAPDAAAVNRLMEEVRAYRV
jgi:hypothetical protein